MQPEGEALGGGGHMSSTRKFNACYLAFYDASPGERKISMFSTAVGLLLLVFSCQAFLSFSLLSVSCPEYSTVLFSFLDYCNPHNTDGIVRTKGLFGFDRDERAEKNRKALEVSFQFFGIRLSSLSSYFRTLCFVSAPAYA